MAVVLAPIVALHGLGSIALVTVLAGLIVVAAGVSGLGRAVTFLPWPVIEGFTLGIAAIIFLQQVPNAIGSPAPAGRGTLRAAYEVVAHVIGYLILGAMVVVPVWLISRLLKTMRRSDVPPPPRGGSV